MSVRLEMFLEKSFSRRISGDVSLAREMSVEVSGKVSYSRACYVCSTGNLPCHAFKNLARPQNVIQMEFGSCKLPRSYRRIEQKCGMGWRLLIGSPKLQIIFHKRATKYGSLLRKMTYEDEGSYESSPPCTQNCDDPTFCFPSFFTWVILLIFRMFKNDSDIFFQNWSGFNTSQCVSLVPVHLILRAPVRSLGTFWSLLCRGSQSETRIITKITNYTRTTIDTSILSVPEIHIHYNSVRLRTSTSLTKQAPKRVQSACVRAQEETPKKKNDKSSP